MTILAFVCDYFCRKTYSKQQSYVPLIQKLIKAMGLVCSDHVFEHVVLKSFLFKLVFSNCSHLRHLRELKSRSNDFMSMRYNLLHKALLYFCSKAMIDEIEQEVLLVKKIDLIATKVKETKDNVG